jgi:hypothetical protein
MTPALYYYRYGGGNGYGTADPGYKIGFTLGNMGYSSVQCATIPIALMPYLYLAPTVRLIK